MKDLSNCLSVGEIRPGPNPFIRAAERKLGALNGRNVIWDEKTLRDPKKIVASVLSNASREAYDIAQYCPEDLPQGLIPLSAPFNEPLSPSSPRATAGNEESVTESQMIHELDQFKKQKETLLRENLQAVLESAKDLHVSPSQSVLH